MSTCIRCKSIREGRSNVGTERTSDIQAEADSSQEALEDDQADCSKCTKEASIYEGLSRYENIDVQRQSNIYVALGDNTHDQPCSGACGGEQIECSVFGEGSRVYEGLSCYENVDLRATGNEYAAIGPPAKQLGNQIYECVDKKKVQKN